MRPSSCPPDSQFSGDNRHVKPSHQISRLRRKHVDGGGFADPLVLWKSKQVLTQKVRRKGRIMEKYERKDVGNKYQCV